MSTNIENVKYFNDVLNFLKNIAFFKKKKKIQMSRIDVLTSFFHFVVSFRPTANRKLLNFK